MRKLETCDCEQQFVCVVCVAVCARRAHRVSFILCFVRMRVYIYAWSSVARDRIHLNAESSPAHTIVKIAVAELLSFLSRCDYASTCARVRLVETISCSRIALCAMRDATAAAHRVLDRKRI